MTKNDYLRKAQKAYDDGIISAEAYDTMIENVELRHNMASVSREMIGKRFEKGFVRKCLYDYYDEILKDC